jgi:hypothetical protein
VKDGGQDDLLGVSGLGRIPLVLEAHSAIAAFGVKPTTPSPHRSTGAAGSLVQPLAES